MLPFVTVLPFVTLFYPLLPLVILCYPVLPIVTLCYPVLPFLTLCYPVLPLSMRAVVIGLIHYMLLLNVEVHYISKDGMQMVVNYPLLLTYMVVILM